MLVRQSGSEKSQVLEDYINLRLEINEHYPVMLSEYDRDKLEMWALTAEMLCNHGEALGDTMAQEVLEISHLLSQIVAAEKEYNALKADILDMMDVFNEINRLHTKDAEGKNASFTIAAERVTNKFFSILFFSKITNKGFNKQTIKFSPKIFN